MRKKGGEVRNGKKDGKGKGERRGDGRMKKKVSELILGSDKEEMINVVIKLDANEVILL